MSSVHYKFKSCLNYDTVTFDGLHISLADLKKAIIQQKKLGKSVEFDLQITNAQSNERYVCDDALIPKNASVIVTRVPVNEPQRSQMRTWLPRSDDYRKSPNNQDFMHDRLSQTPDLANADASENDKIEAMLAQSKFFDPLSYSKGKALSGTPPLGYVCFKCGKPGHYIYSCSLKGEPNMGDMKIKRSTGIPLSFLTVVDSPDHPGALLTHSGHFAVPTIDAMAYKMGKKERPPFLPDPTPVTTAAVVSAPSELLCPLCNELLTDAVVIPCCGNSFCDECVRNALLDSEDHECPSCHEIDVSPDKLISNILLRQAVINYHNQTGYTKVKRDPIVAQQQQQQQQQPQPPQSQQQEQQQPPPTQQAQMKMNQLQPTAQLPSMPQQMQKTAAQALPPAAATSAPLAAAAAAAAVVAPATAPAAAAAEGVPLAAAPAGAHPQHPVHTPLVAPADSRLPSGEQGPNPLHDDKPISHRPGEPHKGMAVPVLGARLRNIRPLQLVRDMNRMPGPMRGRLADRSAVVRNPGHPHQIAPVMQHMPQVLTSAQQQTPASYIPSRATLPAATMPGPTYRMPHPPPPGVSTGPVMPPPSGFIAPPIAPYSAGPRLYQIRSVPTGPRPLTPEEFYREKRRLIEEDKKKSDPFDDFARELMEFRQEQKRRQVDLNYTLSSSRSRSRSNSRSYSRSPRSLSRSPYRSRSSSRSRSRSRYRSSSPSRGGSSSSRSRSSSRGPPPASSRGRRYRSRTRSRSRSRSYTPARKYSRSRSRSRSMSRSRSRSRSPLSTFYHHHHHHRHSRSPGRSRRSRTPPYRSRGRTRSPLAPISTRDPFYRKDWSPSYSRSLRSTAAPAGASTANSSSHGPGKRFSPPERPFPPRFPHYTPPQRPEDYYRYDSHAYEDYYRDYFSRYAPHTTYPAPSTLTASAASSVATGYDRPYYDMRGRPVTQPIAPAAVNAVVGSNSPPNRPRKRPVSRSPLRRERTRDKGDSKTGKSAAGAEPAAAAKPTKEKTKKASKVVDEDGHHKRLERKREEKAERLAREKSSAVGLVSTKKSTSRAGEKVLSKEKKKAESKRVKSEKASASKNPSVPLDMYGKQGSENLKDGGCPVNTNNPGSTAATAAGATNTTAVSSVAAAKRREAAEKTVGGAAGKRMQETHVDPQAVASNPKMVHLTTLADAKETAHVGDTRAVAVASSSSSSRAVVTAASAAASSAAKLKRKARLQQQPVELTQKGSVGPSTEDIEKALTSKKNRRDVSAAEKGLQEAEYGSKALEWSGRHESDMMLPAPELSKWERDDYEVHMEPMKPKKKPLERKPLPKSVIESAEKAITEKRLKPSMLPPRKVYVDDKDTRKPGSVQITIAGGEKSRVEPVDRRIAVGRNHRPTSREAALVSPSAFSSSAAGPSSNVASAAVAAAGSASLSSVSSQAKVHHHHHHHHQPQRQRHHHHHHQDVRIARSSDSKDGGGGGGSGGLAARVGERFERKESMVDEAKFVPDYSESGSDSDDVAASGNTDVAADPSEVTSSRRVTSGSGARRSSSSRTAGAAGGSGSRVGGSSGDAGVAAPAEEQEEPSGKRRSGKRSKESGGGSSGGTSGKKNKKHKKHKKHKSKKSKHKSKKSHKQRHRSGSREKSAARLLHQSAAAAMPSSSPGAAVAALSAGVPSASLSTAATTATTKGHATYHHDPTHQPVDAGKVRSSIATKY